VAEQYLSSPVSHSNDGIAEIVSILSVDLIENASTCCARFLAETRRLASARKKELENAYAHHRPRDLLFVVEGKKQFEAGLSIRYERIWIRFRKAMKATSARVTPKHRASDPHQFTMKYKTVHWVQLPACVCSAIDFRPESMMVYRQERQGLRGGV
jgi:hypothetical protein